MAEHSPLPWKVAYEITGENAWDANGSAYFAIKDAKGEELFSIDRDEEELANRIVACVNACRGIPTNMLESVAKGEAEMGWRGPKLKDGSA
jgi:hypothetical protein